ncbi:MAG: lysophospholipid acyltransferase family protein [Geminicoccaceae bacterium]
MRPRPVRAALRLAAFLGLTAALLPFALLALLGSRAALLRVRAWWSQGVCALLGVRVTRQGRAFTACPTLFVVNHVSYLDVPVLGALLGGTFVAKAEVAGWPLIGQLARLCGTFFVRRHWRQALIQRNALAARLRRGESFVLFAEGTSGNGLGVRRFKTSLLSVAEPWVLDCPIAVQPVTLAFVRLADGTPVSARNCHLYAWYDDALLAPHLWQVLQMDGIEVQVILHEPVLSWSVQSRKILGRQLEQQIAASLAQARAAGPAEAAAALAARAAS